MRILSEISIQKSTMEPMLIFFSLPKSLKKKKKNYVFIRPSSRPLVSTKCDKTLPKVGELFVLVNVFLIIFKMIFIREVLHEK